MTHEIELKGCAPTPLAHYLKALGILRLVAEQKDPNAKGCWRDEAFVLQSSLDQKSLLRFFLDEYRPTPITAPWNGGSGFFKDDKQNRQALLVIRNSTHPRLEYFRNVIFLCEKAINRLGLEVKPNDREKDKLLVLLRSSLPENGLAWLDAAIAMTEKNGELTRKPTPLLGKGGNEARLEFSNNFIQKIAEIININDDNSFPDKSFFWLECSLFNVASPGFVDSSPGMLLPFASGGPNASNGFEAGSKVNPWDYVLMLEGAVVFASSSTRKLESSISSFANFPFTVKANGSGQGGLSQKDSNQAHNEIWLPIWKAPGSYLEIRSLFSEGRATIKSNTARDGLDFARSISSLGVDRGIQQFSRTGFLERRAPGQGYYITTSLGSFSTNIKADSDLINDLDENRFLQDFIRLSNEPETSNVIAGLGNQLETKIFSFLRQKGDRKLTQDILILLGKIQRAIGRSRNIQKRIVKPIQSLNPGWLVGSNDDSSEFRLACALASTGVNGMAMRFHFANIKHEKYYDTWDNESRLAVWGEGSLQQNLNETLRCRWLAAQRLSHTDKPFSYGFGANQADIAAFLHGSLDDRRISDLAQGLALIKEFNPTGLQTPTTRHAALPAAYGLLKPFFVPDRELARIGFLAADAQLPLRGELLSWLAANQTQKAVDWAWAKLRQAGVGLPHFPQQAPRAVGIDGPRLLATLAFPLAFGQLKNLLLTLGANEVSTEKEAESSL